MSPQTCRGQSSLFPPVLPGARQALGQAVPIGRHSDNEGPRGARLQTAAGPGAHPSRGREGAGWGSQGPHTTRRCCLFDHFNTGNAGPAAGTLTQTLRSWGASRSGRACMSWDTGRLGMNTTREPAGEDHRPRGSHASEAVEALNTGPTRDTSHQTRVIYTRREDGSTRTARGFGGEDERVLPCTGGRPPRRSCPLPSPAARHRRRLL